MSYNDSISVAGRDFIESEVVGFDRKMHDGLFKAMRKAVEDDWNENYRKIMNLNESNLISSKTPNKRQLVEKSNSLGKLLATYLFDTQVVSELVGRKIFDTGLENFRKLLHEPDYSLVNNSEVEGLRSQINPGRDEFGPKLSKLLTITFGKNWVDIKMEGDSPRIQYSNDLISDSKIKKYAY